MVSAQIWPQAWEKGRGFLGAKKVWRGVWKNWGIEELGKWGVGTLRGCACLNAEYSAASTSSTGDAIRKAV